MTRTEQEIMAEWMRSATETAKRTLHPPPLTEVDYPSKEYSTVRSSANRLPSPDDRQPKPE